MYSSSSGHASLRTNYKHVNNNKKKRHIDMNNLPPEILELVSSNTEKKNWKGMIVALLVILLICALIILAIVFTTPILSTLFGNKEKNYGELFNFSEVFVIPGMIRQFKFDWIGNDTLLYFSPKYDIMKYSVQNRTSFSRKRKSDVVEGITFESKMFLSRLDFDFSLKDFALSADQKFILVPFKEQQAFRHSKVARYKVIKLERSASRGVERIVDISVDGGNHQFLQHARWCSLNNCIAVVFNNNIYLSANAFSNNYKRITNSTSNLISYGISDWLYEEEILGTSLAFWWNSNARWIAYMSFDQSQVKQFSYPHFDKPNIYYPQFKSVFYPKCGATQQHNENLYTPPQNPRVGLHAYSVDEDREVIFEPPIGLKFNGDYYITFVKWFNSSAILAGFLDRRQQIGGIALCVMPRIPQATPRFTAIKGQCQQIWKSPESTMGWIPLMKQISQEPLMDPNNNYFYTIVYGGIEPYHWRRATRVEIINGISNNNQIRYLTPDGFDVIDLLRLSDDQRYLFFKAARLQLKKEKAVIVEGPMEQHVYRLLLDANRTSWYERLICVTCPQTNWNAIQVNKLRHTSATVLKQSSPISSKIIITNKLHKQTDNCTFNEVSFSPDGHMILQQCLGPQPYIYFLRRNAEPFDALTILENNEEVSELLSRKKMPVRVYKQIVVRSDNELTDRLWISLDLPAQLDPTSHIKYPLMLHVYGGPGVQMVKEQVDQRPMWAQFLSSSHDIITAKVDGRGTGNRGGAFLHSIRGRLADVEVEDTILALKHLLNISYVDPTRIILFGWSYGGFLVTHVLGSDLNRHNNNPLVRCGIAVNPVTDFRYYDTAYTERYMGLVMENKVAYERTNISNKAKNFKNKDLFLVVGSADDNVHMQNTIHFVNALVDADVDFRLSMYPDATHAISGTKRRRHLFRSMTNFLLECFNRTSIT